MTLIAYESWNPKPESLDTVARASIIIDEYQEAGYTLTLRQLYYQFVARDWMGNSDKNYKNLGKLITKARMAGLISWDTIEDRNRGHNAFWYQEDDSKIIQGLPHHVRFDRWARQDFYVEVWVEKEALGNVISRACDPLLVPHMSCKGYLSASEAWRAGRRFKEKLEQGKRCVMLHLGDHDPSGIDMTRDNSDRLQMFSSYADGVLVKRLALNMDQVDEYQPPPNPTKLKDSRSNGYIERFGFTSWELDALEPQVITGLITDQVEDLIDWGEWEKVRQEEEAMKDMMRELYGQWDTVKKGLL